MKPLLLLFTYGLFTSHMALADLSETDISRVKCYVELLGGATGVYTFSSSDKTDTPRKLRKQVLGFKVYVKNSPEKLPIYKIHECVYADKNFTMNQAQTLDKGPA